MSVLQTGYSELTRFTIQNHMEEWVPVALTTPPLPVWGGPTSNDKNPTIFYYPWPPPTTTMNNNYIISIHRIL